MASQAIHFGTSGWRGIIADDFTFPRVRIASAAIAAHVLAHRKKPTLIVGHDTRFFSEEFARTSASVLRSSGCHVLLCGEATPTPAMAHAIIHNKLDGGVNITASRNPASYNGLKFSGPEGGPALPEVTKDIEKRAAALADDPAPHQESEGDFNAIDPRAPYFDQLHKMIRFDVLNRARGRFVCDAMHGCGAGWLDRILTESGITATAIRTKRDVLFDGSGPDPSEENLAPLKEALLGDKALAGLATDGDADRFGILDRDGSFISPHHILGLLFDYLLETRGHKLGASRSVATTHLLDAVAKLHGVQAYETLVGINYAGPLLREDKIVMGGEQSSGLTVRGHVPEKDGILACLLVGEMIAARQSSLTDQRSDLFRRIGREYWPVRVSLHLDEDAQASLPERLSADFKEFAGRHVASVNRRDGLKLIFDNDEWILMRPSGTEPLIRVYTEAGSLDESEKLAEQGRAWITQ
ncbi:MAG: phosphoglucomutase/phosphomannomutase family protein [Candidatus Acidiferrales bacterium]|jgi:phosphomannomutase